MTGLRRRAVHLVLATLPAVAVGCVRAEPDVGAQTTPSVGDVGRRAAVLIAGAEIEYATGPQGQALARPAGPHFRATATAVTEDGYYLTAAHCVERGPVHLLVGADDGLAFRPAEVVWSSRAEGYTEDWADLALIHIEAERSAAALAAPFPWAGAAHLSPGTPAMAARMHVAGPASLRTGHLVEASGRRPGPVPLTCLIHDLLLEPGYSGGPLVHPSGRLLGINVRAKDRVLLESGEWLTVGVAVRPDAAAVERLIREHRGRGAFPSTRRVVR